MVSDSMEWVNIWKYIHEYEIYYSDSKKLCFALAISRMALKRILARSDMVCGVRVLGLSFVV